MNSRPALKTLALRRRPSRLSVWLTSKKLEEVRRLSPEQRLSRALELSDFCQELARACSPKR